MFDRILLPLDGSQIAECVLPHARALVRAFGAQLIVAHVLEYESEESQEQSMDPLSWHLRKAEAESYLEEVRTRLAEGGTPVQIELLQGDAAERLVKFAREEEVDLILMSSHGRSGLSAWNVSGVVQKIIYRANTSLMLVRAYRTDSVDEDEVHYRHILAPLDGSRRAECIFPVLNGLARDEETEAVLTHVVVRPEMPRRAPLPPEDAALAEKIVERNREEAEKYLEQVRARLDHRVQTRVLVGDDLISALHNQTEQSACDLVILSAHGYSGDSRRPFGSVVTSFIMFSSRPVLIIQDLLPDEIDGTRAEEVAEDTGKSDSGKGGRTAVHAS